VHIGRYMPEASLTGVYLFAGFVYNKMKTAGNICRYIPYAIFSTKKIQQLLSRSFAIFDTTYHLNYAHHKN